MQRYNPCTPSHANDYQRLEKSEHGEAYLAKEVDDEIADKQLLLDTALTELKWMDAKIAEKNAEIAALTHDLNRLTRGSWSKEISKKDEEIAEKDISIKGLIIAAHRYEDEIKRRGEQIATMQARIKELEEDIRELMEYTQKQP